ncbi:hypothetical protein [Nocardia cyriacigeorgica]|uniref:hypothetical protein n=1 Tax=Nocardia cyriacigeorgica TaxID=135487 RepID=UPI0024569083|nr:hypothetical protein [Nocardia cyriacigeorgica]
MEPGGRPESTATAHRSLDPAGGGGAGGGLGGGVVAGGGFGGRPLAAIAGRGEVRRIGVLGYAAAVAGRILARCVETGRRPQRDDVAAAIAHPIAVGAYLALWVRSRRARRANALVWKGRALPA